jgi:hypothetical protein
MTLRKMSVRKRTRRARSQLALRFVSLTIDEAAAWETDAVCIPGYPRVRAALLFLPYQNLFPINRTFPCIFQDGNLRQSYAIIVLFSEHE